MRAVRIAADPPASSSRRGPGPRRARRIALLALAAFAAAPARAGEVYPGCAVPPEEPTGRVWHFDAGDGSDDGDGSEIRPWKTLQTLTSVVGGKGPLLSTAPYGHRDKATGKWLTAPNPDAPVKPGDTLRLATGDYGSLRIGGAGAGVQNDAFVTVEAASGQQPRLTSLNLSNTSKWRFRNLKLQALADGYTPLVLVSGARDVVLDGLSLSSQDDTRGWSQEDWMKKGRSMALRIGGSSPSGETVCTAITNSAIFNVRSGVALFGDKTVFADNSIDRFGDDALDYGANDLLIARNRVTNNANLNNGVHVDAMQGQIGHLPAGKTSNTFDNVVIDRNLIIRQTDPDLPLSGPMQGITAFDMDWSRLKVTNNIVVTSACHGIGFGSVHGGLIANNTVLDDGSDAGTKNTAGNIMCRPWVAVSPRTHQGSPSNDVTVRNNIATGFSIDNSGGAVVADHNLCTQTRGRCRVSFHKDGRLANMDAPGLYGDGATVTDIMTDRNGPSGQFVDFAPRDFRFDVHLRAGATAIGFGNPDRAPAVDFAGAPRKPPIDAGAYAYQGPVDGACGQAADGRYTSAPAAGLCRTGTSSGVAAAGRNWRWSCAGRNGGASASCVAER